MHFYVHVQCLGKSAFLHLTWCMIESMERCWWGVTRKNILSIREIELWDEAVFQPGKGYWMDKKRVQIMTLKKNHISSSINHEHFIWHFSYDKRHRWKMKFPKMLNLKHCQGKISKHSTRKKALGKELNFYIFYWTEINVDFLKRENDSRVILRLQYWSEFPT